MISTDPSLPPDVHDCCRYYYNFETVAQERQSNCTKIVQRQYGIRMQNKHLIDRSTQSVKIRNCTIILRCPCSILAAVFLPLKIVRSSQQKWTSQESGLRRYGWRTVHNFARNSCSILTKSNIKQPYDSRNTIVNK